MKTTTQHPFSQRGLSTKEWVVGLALVGVLLLVAISYFMPVYCPVVGRSQEAKSLNNARQIALACRLYGQDHEGVFPTGSEPGSSPTNANTVFQDLFTTGDIGLEALFWNPRATHVCVPAEPDEDGILAPGENAFDYVFGLTFESRADLPLIIEAQTSPHRWDRDHGHPWEGRVIVAFVDASATTMDTRTGTHDIVVPHAIGEMDLLSVEDEESGVPGNLPPGTVVLRAAVAHSVP